MNKYKALMTVVAVAMVGEAALAITWATAPAPVVEPVVAVPANPVVDYCVAELVPGTRAMCEELAKTHTMDTMKAYITKQEREYEADKAKREKEAAVVAKALKAQAKREGVRLGMSPQEVRDSSWGKPTDINRTTSVHGTSEQWVYRHNGGYLYFDNGVLTSVQN